MPLQLLALSSHIPTSTRPSIPLDIAPALLHLPEYRVVRQSLQASADANEGCLDAKQAVQPHASLPAAQVAGVQRKHLAVLERFDTLSIDVMQRQNLGLCM